MSGARSWSLERVREYYRETTESNYLPRWSGASLALHLGLDGDGPTAHLQSLSNTNRVLADLAGIGANTVVLDAGCGVGGTAIQLARERGARVVGVSIEPGQVEWAARFARAAGVADRTSFHCLDFTRTGFAARSFEVVFNLESICHVREVGAYLEHARTLLRPGGRFACIDCFLGERPDSACVQAMCEGWVLPSVKAAEKVTSALDEHGFAQIRVEDLTARVRRSGARMRHIAREGLALLARQPPAPLREAHARAAIAAADGLVTGAIRYLAVVAEAR
jgi:SAM-dependent methyltransferase